MGFLALPEFQEDKDGYLSSGRYRGYHYTAVCRSARLEINDLLLLERALTHRSYLNEHSEALEDNERLEFLGDAVLDFLVGSWLYHQFPEMQEGDLTRLRSALVRTEQLAEFAREIGLGPVMLLGRGEAENGGRSRPALLCATFEALIGALYLDSGLIEVQLFIEPRLTEATRRIIADHKEKDPKAACKSGYNRRDLDRRSIRC